MNEGSELEGKVVQCKYCNEQWLFESKTKYLENRLDELNSDLDNTELKINLRKKEFQNKINLLEDDLKIKKSELEIQKLLQDKVSTFENRLKETEKLNAEELSLNEKIGKIKKQIRVTANNISNFNKDIEEKTNYLETKINSYNNEENIVDESSDESKSQMIENEVIDINIKKNISKSQKINKDQSESNRENKKNRFFSPNFLK
jgi:hypothetical protein